MEMTVWSNVSKSQCLRIQEARKGKLGDIVLDPVECKSLEETFISAQRN
jgi:hypothetical protein